MNTFVDMQLNVTEKYRRQNLKMYLYIYLPSWSYHLRKYCCNSHIHCRVYASKNNHIQWVIDLEMLAHTFSCFGIFICPATILDKTAWFWISALVSKSLKIFEFLKGDILSLLLAFLSVLFQKGEVINNKQITNIRRYSSEVVAPIKAACIATCNRP